MDNNNSLSHIRWNCKYHIAFAPKYRIKVFYKEKREQPGTILRMICDWKKIRIIEAEDGVQVTSLTQMSGRTNVT